MSMSIVVLVALTIGDGGPCQPDLDPPTIVCPDDVNVQCLSEIPAPDPGAIVASDACGDVIVEFVEDQPGGGFCPLFVLRTYRATDESGNSSVCTQLFTVLDTTAPIIECPEDLVLECGDDVPPPAPNLPAVDNCGVQLPAVFLGDAQVSCDEGCSLTICRRYFAKDACANFTVCTQEIRIVAPGGEGCACTPCPWDITGDGEVGPADLAQLLDAWGESPGDPADFNDDGTVGPADLAALLENWGRC